MYLESVMILFISILKYCASNRILNYQSGRSWIHSLWHVHSQQGEERFKLRNLFSLSSSPPRLPLPLFVQENVRLSEIIVSVLN